jgi:conjugative transfer signal peptidase TraF
VRRIILTEPASRWFLVSSAVLCVLTAAALHVGLRLNLTPSLPMGVYQATDGQVVTGAVVVACLPDAVAGLAAERGYVARGRPRDAGRTCPGGLEPIGKLVLAVAGDTVEVREAGLRVNGREVPRSGRFPRDAEGRPVPRVSAGVHVVRAGDLWLLASVHRRSFDSRYFGPVPADNVLSVVAPVWVWGSQDLRFWSESDRPVFVRRKEVAK